MTIKITKMQGCGNDFVIVDYEELKNLSLSCSNQSAGEERLSANDNELYKRGEVSEFAKKITPHS